MGLAQCFDQRIRHRHFRAAPTGDENEVSFGYSVEAVGDQYLHPTHGCQRSFIHRRDLEAIPGLSDFRSLQGEDFDADTKFKSAKPVIRENGDIWAGNSI